MQVDLTATTNYSTGIKTRLNSEGVLSGSAQVVAALPSGTVSGSSQILAGTTIHSGAFFNGISVVSGSAQISFGSITGVPSGLVSGSSQISFGSISSIPSGLVSGSSQVTGIGNAQLTNSSFNIGTTSISLGRASASQTLTGVSIDGNAGTVTNGVYTTGDQSISGTKTFAVIKGDSGADYPHSFTNTDAGNTHWTNRNGRMLTSNGTNWASDGKDPIMAIVGSTADTTRGRMIGITFHNDNNTVNAFSPTISFSAKSNSTGYNSQYASIYGRNSGTASGLDTNWNKGELHFTVHGDTAVSDTPTLKLTQTISTFDTNLVVNNGTKTYFNSTDGYAIKVDSSSSSTENDIRFAKGGTDYGAIQTNGSDHGFEFYVNTDGSGSGWQRMFYMKRDATESVFDRGTVRPGANGTQNLGTASYRWSTIYTSDLSLSNGIGDYTIVEGEEKLYLYNNKNNKVYSFVLQEEDPATATPKKS